jgi:hypothetical protein
MMRYLLLLTLATAACTDVPSSGLQYDSVRERLADRPTSLYVHDEASSGAVTARRWERDAWITTTTPLAIPRGHMRAAIDDSGALTIDQLEIAVGPVTMDRIFGKPAQLQNVALRLAKPLLSDTAWTSDDDATATLTMVFDFNWSIAFDGGRPFTLPTQRLPPESVHVELAGDGDHVRVLLDIDASGELWNWNDLVQITDVSISLSAETAY